MFKYICTFCRSDDINIRVLINPNTHKLVKDIDDRNSKECYCNTCHSYSTFKKINVSLSIPQLELEKLV